MAAHSPIGGSTIGRVLQCPGSVALCAKAPPQKASKYALEGTAAHVVAERLLKGEVEAWELVGEVPDEMIEGAQLYVDFIRSLGAGELLVEYKFNLKRLDPRAFGTADAVVIHEWGLDVCDYKYGAGVAVEIEDNTQLIFYSMGVLEKYKRSKIRLHIVQPRAQHDDGPIRSCTLDRVDIATWFVKFQRAIRDSEEPDAPLETGPYCRWCPAFPICPEQKKMVVADATHDFTAVDPIVLPSGDLLTPTQVSAVLKQKPIIEAWLKSVEEYAQNELEIGHDVPGFKVVAGRGSRSWANEEDAKKYLLRELKGNAFQSKLISVAQAEKFKLQLPEHLVKYSEGVPRITEVKDKRPALKSKLSDEFSQIKGE